MMPGGKRAELQGGEEIVTLQVRAGAGDDQLGGRHVLAQLVAQVREALPDRLELDAVVEQRSAPRVAQRRSSSDSEVLARI
jgi:hypothetical protein